MTISTIPQATAIPQPLEVLCLLESGSYKCTDYLQKVCLTTTNPNDADISIMINESWREKICKWTFEVIDHFEFQRETAFIALSYLDRFLSSRPVNHRTFQLLSMTTLYLAVKLYEPKTLQISSLTELSRGLFNESHLSAMELVLLSELDWKVHPPTPQNFSKHFQHFLPIDNERIKLEILDLADFLMELSVCDYFFVTRKPSSIAMASILNALDIVCPKLASIGISSVTIKRSLLRQIKKALPDLNFTSTPEVAECRIQLKVMYDEALQNQLTGIEHINSTDVGSPKSVVTDDEGQSTFTKRKRY